MGTSHTVSITEHSATEPGALDGFAIACTCGHRWTCSLQGMARQQANDHLEWHAKQGPEDVDADVAAALEAHEAFRFGIETIGTGGNCTAIEVILAAGDPDDDPGRNGGRWLLITDREWEAALAPTREERSGWMVGYYGPENQHSAEDPGRDLLETPDASVEALVALCLRLANGPVSPPSKGERITITHDAGTESVTVTSWNPGDHAMPAQVHFVTDTGEHCWVPDSQIVA